MDNITYTSTNYINVNGETLPLKSFNFENQTAFNKALNQGLIVPSGSCIWLEKEQTLNRYKAGEGLTALLATKSSEAMEQNLKFFEGYEGNKTGAAQTLVDEWEQLKQTPNALLLNSLYTKGEGMGIKSKPADIVSDFDNKQSYCILTYPTGIGRYIVKIKTGEVSVDYNLLIKMWIFPYDESFEGNKQFYNEYMIYQKPDFVFDIFGNDEKQDLTLGSIIIPQYKEDNKKIIIWNTPELSIDTIYILPHPTTIPTEVSDEGMGIIYDGGNASGEAILTWIGGE